MVSGRAHIPLPGDPDDIPLPGDLQDLTAGEEARGRQDEPRLNGLRSHVAYGDRPAPRSQVWTFRVYGNEEPVCSPMHQTTVGTGRAHQDANRAKGAATSRPASAAP